MIRLSFRCLPLMCCSLILSCGADNAPVPEPAAPKVDTSRTQTQNDLHDLRSRAYEQQRQKKWLAAEALWKELLGNLSKLPDDPESRSSRKEAEVNLQLLESLCRPQQEPVAELSLEEPPPSARPEKVSEEHLLKHYPAGKTVRSVAHLVITGSGVNRDWFFEGQANFVYQYKVEAETKVKSNNGQTLRMEIWFPKVTQTRAVSDKELQLRFPESPLAGVVWDQVEENILRHDPAYVTVRKIAGIVNMVDPRAKRTLTAFANQLQRFGVKLDDSEHIELAAQIERLNGIRLEVEYVSGIGVNKIRVLNGEPFDRDDLERIAYNLSLLMDYYIFPGAEKRLGDRWTVRAEDVVSLMSLGHEIEATGSLNLERGPDKPTRDGKSQAILKLVSGEVNIKDPRGRNAEAVVRVRSGLIDYSLEDLLVREAEISWSAGTAWVSTDHLLFGAERLRNVEVKSLYSAEKVGEKP